MTDPARLLDTNLDCLSRRAIEAAVSDEPPIGAKAELWTAIAVALPTAGVLVGATTTAGAAALGGKTAAGTAGAAISSAVTAGSAVTTGAVASTAASAIGATSTSLGLIAAKAVALGLGIGLAVSATTVSVQRALGPNVSAPAATVLAVPEHPKPKPWTVAMAEVPNAPAIEPATQLPKAADSVAQRSTLAQGTAPIAEVAAETEPQAVDATASDELSEESQLLVRARRALGASDGALALALLFEHRQRFAAGKLAQERDALEVQALVMAGRLAEAQARARAFAVHFPMSPHNEKMSTILKEAPGR